MDINLIQPQSSIFSGEIVVRDDKTGKFVDGHPKLGGKEKGYRSFSALWDESIEDIAKLNNITIQEANKVIIKKAWSKAKNGHYQYYKDILDRLLGTAQNNLNVNATISKVVKIDE